MNQQFYIAVNGQQTGPFTIDELKAKSIQRDTLVWTEGIDNWTRAEHIPLLKDVLKATPPPIPNVETKTTTQQVPPPPTPTPPPITNDKYFGYELARRRERFFAYLAQSLIILIPLLIIFGKEILDSNEDFSIGSLFIDAIIGAIVGAIFGAIFYPIWSGNLGHKIFGLKVISSEDGSDYIEVSRGALREAVKGALSAFFIPAMWLLWDDNRQNLYDKVVKTYVVKKK